MTHLTKKMPTKRQLEYFLDMSHGNSKYHTYLDIEKGAFVSDKIYYIDKASDREEAG